MQISFQTDIQSVYTRKTRASRLYRNDASGTEEELYSVEAVPAILEKRASV